MVNKRYDNKSSVTRAAGWIFCVGFLTASLYDIDHPLSVWLGIEDGRFLHEVFYVGGLIAVIIGGGICVTLLVRLAWSRFLRLLGW